MRYRNGFLYVYNLNKEWKLVLPSTFNAEGKNFMELAIVKAHAATTHVGIEKTMKALTDKFECQPVFRLVGKYVGHYDICQGTKYSRRGPIQYATLLHVLVRLWSNITIDFLKLSTVLTKCSLLYLSIPVGEDHIV